jgi:hypothetical protein
MSRADEFQKTFGFRGSQSVLSKEVGMIHRVDSNQGFKMDLLESSVERFFRSATRV